MLRNAPSLEAAEAFVTAARANSFREAAESIALSPSAFSRRIQVLERFVGVPLFDRSQERLSLTEAGARYLGRIEPAMEMIRVATEELRHRADHGRLRLVTSHSIAVGWLMPRLPRLYQAHGIQLEISTGRGAHLLRSGEVDLAIWASVPDIDDYGSTTLMELECAVAAAPLLADGRTPPSTLEEVRQHKRLSVKSPPDAWAPWARQMGASAECAGTTTFETSHLMYEAAAAGLGLTLVAPMIADRFVQERRLVPCLGESARMPSEYRLIFADARLRRRRDVRLLGEWLSEQAQASMAAFQAWRQGRHRAAGADA